MSDDNLDTLIITLLFDDQHEFWQFVHYQIDNVHLTRSDLIVTVQRECTELTRHVDQIANVSPDNTLSHPFRDSNQIKVYNEI